MRTSRIFFVMFFLGALLVCGTRSAGAQDGDGCEGLGDYRTAMLEAGRDYLAALEDAGVPAGSDRDPLTYSSSEWDALAAASADYQGALRDIEPPAFAADWHRAQIELRGLAEQVAKAAAKDGVLALAAFTDAIEQNETDTANALAAATAACPDFAAFQREHDLLDGQVEGTPEAAGRPDAVPVGETGVVADLLSVEVLEVYADPAEIDPEANWFVDWLDENPRPQGSEFFTVRLRLTNVGREPVTAFDFSVGFAADSGADYSRGESCGTVPGSMSFGDTLQPGDSIDANFCSVVRERDVDTLVAYVEPPFSFAERERVYFELPE